MSVTKKAILVVSFGTSYVDNCKRTIGAIESDIANAFPEYEVRRAFTSGMIIKKIAKRDGIQTDNVADALDRLSEEEFTDVIIQPTHIMNGIEYEEIVNSVIEHAAGFASVRIGAPVLTTNEDYDNVLEAIKADIIPQADQTVGKKHCIVLMGHGTEHYANSAYSQLQYKLYINHMSDVFVTTVEGFPSFEDTIRVMDGCGYRDVVLFPFMLVAGDHANNDMASDDEDSLKTALVNAGYNVYPVIKGLGEFPAFRKLFIQHIRNAMQD